MIKTILRLEDANGGGPFEYSPNYWRSHPHNAETEKHLDEYFFGFAEIMPWVRIHVADPFERLFGMPEKFWEGNDDQHPHHDSDVETHPSPAEMHKWKVGCKDMDQLLHWFPRSSHDFLAKYGFELVTYECDCAHIHFGEYQLLFCVDHITAVKRQPLLGV